MSTQSTPQDYFSFSQQFDFVLPDGISKIKHKRLTEGQRIAYEDKTSREIVVDQTSEKASVELKPGSARFELLKIAIVDWELYRIVDGKTQPVGFSPEELNNFLLNADPDIIDKIEQDIQDKNKWIGSNQFKDVASIDKQIERLKKLREDKLKAEKK